MFRKKEINSFIALFLTAISQQANAFVYEDIGTNYQIFSNSSYSSNGPVDHAGGKAIAITADYYDQLAENSAINPYRYGDSTAYIDAQQPDHEFVYSFSQAYDFSESEQYHTYTYSDPNDQGSDVIQTHYVEDATYAEMHVWTEYLYRLDIADLEGAPVADGTTISVNFDYQLAVGYVCSPMDTCDATARSSLSIFGWDKTTDSITDIAERSLNIRGGWVHGVYETLDEVVITLDEEVLSDSFSIDFTTGADELWVMLATYTFALASAACDIITTNSHGEISVQEYGHCGTLRPVATSWAFADPLITASLDGVDLVVNKQLAGTSFAAAEISAVPVPAAAWLFGSGLLGLVGVARRKKAA